MARKFVYFDIQTTNFDPTAEIVQIGAVGSSRFESISIIIIRGSILKIRDTKFWQI